LSFCFSLLKRVNEGARKPTAQLRAWASYRLRAYSPGVITGMAIYAPLAVYGYVEFLRSGAASIQTALIAGMIGSSYPIWSAAYHKKRTKKL
jgi:uncharacterized membrane protein YjfL (UPF0719 family)